MRFNKFMLAAAAVTMTASPVLAANPAAKLSVAPAARASADQGESKLAGGGFIVAALAAAAVIAGIIIVADNDDSAGSP